MRREGYLSRIAGLVAPRPPVLGWPPYTVTESVTIPALWMTARRPPLDRGPASRSSRHGRRFSATLMTAPSAPLRHPKRRMPASFTSTVILTSCPSGSAT